MYTVMRNGFTDGGFIAGLEGRKYMNDPVIDTTATGENILKLRIQKGLSVRELQSALGFATPQAIYKWQKGQSLPTIDNLVILSEILNVPIDRILIVK